MYFGNYSFLYSITMKTYLFITIMCCLATIGSANAQKKRQMLFEDYSKGVVLMKNNSRTMADLNYDAGNQKMMFKNGQEEMLLTNVAQIDTVYIGDSKFIPTGSKENFYELLPLPNGIIGINWLLKHTSQGYKNAFGVTQQAKVESLNTNQLNYSTYENQYTEVYKLANQNEYCIIREGKPLKFKNKKTLLKLFPNKQTQIEEFMKLQKTNMNNPKDVITLVNYCLGL